MQDKAKPSHHKTIKKLTKCKNNFQKNINKKNKKFTMKKQKEKKNINSIGKIKPMLSTMIKYKLLPKSKKKPKKKNNNLNNYKSNNLNSWNKSVNTTHKISNQKININTSLNYQLKISNKNHQTPNQHQNPKKINVSIILINHNTLAHEHQQIIYLSNYPMSSSIKQNLKLSLNN